LFSEFLFQNTHQNVAVPFAADQCAVALPPFFDKAALLVTGDCATIERKYAQFNPMNPSRSKAQHKTNCVASVPYPRALNCGLKIPIA
jgi:hypothetical protein